MKTQLMKFSYNKNNICFELTGKENVMVNATEMAKTEGKQVVAFLRNEDTKKFIEEALKSENSHFLGIKKESDLIISKQKSGTWMHKVLALKFAAWLSPAFELWVYSTIEKIISGYGKELKTSIQNTVMLRNKLAKLKTTLENENEDFRQYLEIEKQIKRERSSRVRATKNQFQYEMDFYGEQQTNE